MIDVIYISVANLKCLTSKLNRVFDVVTYCAVPCIKSTVLLILPPLVRALNPLDSARPNTCA